MSQADVLRGYAQDAAELIPAFEAIRTTDVLAPVMSFLPIRPSRVLDVGAGTGRDAAWLAGQGHSVTAVEPVDELREAGIALHANENIQWVNDRLPTLRRLHVDSGYELVLAVAVWQHLLPDEHGQAIRVLAGKVAPSGRLILSLRHGPGSASRPCYPADPARIVAYAEEAGMRLTLSRDTPSVQQRNRDAGVTWTWLCFDQPQ